MAKQKELTADQFGKIAGFNNRQQYYVKKMCDNVTKKTINAWSKHFIAVKLIDKAPNILSAIKGDSKK